MADIGDFLQGAGINIPSFKGIGGIFLIILIMVVIAGLAILAAYIFIKVIKYNKKILLFRKVGQVVVPAGKDRGMFERIGKAGDYWLKTRKFKKILPRPKYQMGKNEFWYYEREDGEWINFLLKDFDEQMRTAGAYYVDEDMRLQRLGIQKNLAERFQKVSFWQKYGGMIMSLVFILVITVCLVVLFKEMSGHYAAAQSASAAIERMATAVDALARRTGGGLEPASLLLPLLFRRRK